MRYKDSSKSFGMAACFGSLFRKKPSGFAKGKDTSGTSKSIQGTSKKLSLTSKKSEALKKARDSKNRVVQKSHGVADNFVTMTEFRKKIMSFRDLVDLPPCIGSSTIIELVKDTVKELHMLHPDVLHCISVSDSEGAPMHKVINELCVAIKSLGNHWMHSNEWMVKSKKDDKANGDLEKHALTLLDDIINVARERMFNMVDMDDDEEMKEDVDSPSSSYGKSSTRSYSDKVRFSSSPTTPTSVLPEFPNNKSAKACSKVTFSPPVLLPLRVQAVEKLNVIDIKRVSFQMYPHVAHQVAKSVDQTDNKEQAKRDSEVAEDDERQSGVDEGKNKDGNSDGFVRVQMDILAPPSSLKSIVGAENVQLIPAAVSPSSSLEQPSISAAIQSPPPQLLVSEASQSPPPQPCGESGISPPVPLPKASEDIPPPETATSHTAASSTTALGNIPPPPPPLLSVGKSDMATPVPPPPPPPPSITRSNTTSLSPPPPPPSSMITSNRTTSLSPPPHPPPPLTTSNMATLLPHSPAAPPPMASGNAMPVARGSPPPPPSPAAPGSIPPPPPPMVSSDGLVPAPTPPVQQGKGGAPPPPPVVGGGRLQSKSVSKLKRSSHMGCLYRQLKAKVEGSSSKGKSLQKKGSKVGASGGNGKQGMADALAEMTKRSSYFQQIEEDVKNYANSIKEVKAALISFQTTDMAELVKFHKYVESHLEKLTDETQVLARFEDFPSKKLEGLRMAASLYSKLDAMAATLQNWKIVPPVNQLLDQVENYFNKIKGELDTLDRTKDDEIKKFKSQKIHFDFGILIRIKELMVDVSSSCMELALKEKREASASKTNGKKISSGKILWKAFQFAFRVYSFAGGQDDRADNLTRELAQQIQTDTWQ